MQALELDPLLPEAHASLAYVHQFYEWDWRGAETAFKRAIALNPNYATGYQWYAEYLSAMGRHDEALAEIRKAQTVDPLSLIINAVEANLLYMAGRYDEAIDQGQQVIDMDPNFPEVYEYLKRSYDQKQMYRDAIAARQARRRILGRDVSETPALRAAAEATTPRAYWRQRLAQEIAESRAEGVQPFEFAEILAQAGDTAQALDWLERACRDHDFMIMYVRVAPNLAPLRSQPRYQEVVRRGCPM
jgi:tetratricopeptide (TPR) repeat protein